MAKTILLLAHPLYTKDTEVVSQIFKWWDANGYEVRDVSDQGLDNRIPKDIEVDFVLSLGGDGTMLRAAQLVMGTDIALVGVNFGRLGYLTQIEPDVVHSYFEKLLLHDYWLEEKATLQITTGDNIFFCLNEVTIERAVPGHTISLALEISKSRFISYRGDGVLIATPTGSTAYNLSLGGPILSPTLKAMVLTPIAPHTLFDRSLILGDEEVVEAVLEDNSKALLVADGSLISSIGAGNRISVRAGAHKVRIVRFPGSDFYEVVREKFYMNDR
ncbi:MAG: NAD(+)/NADH kinase [Firmicutes bacterium]|jgi:NAD+ kinase|nr:NAD(+)/NADH kinase [Bacillota bacterium]